MSAHYRDDLQAELLDRLTDDQVLNIIDPSHGHGYEPYEIIPIDADDKAVAQAAVGEWLRLRGMKPKPAGYRALWRGSCACYAGMDAERDGLPSASSHYVIAREWVRSIGRKREAA